MYGLISLAVGAIVRIITTALISFGDKLNWKERVSETIEIKLNSINYLVLVIDFCFDVLDG